MSGRRGVLWALGVLAGLGLLVLGVVVAGWLGGVWFVVLLLAAAGLARRGSLSPPPRPLGGAGVPSDSTGRRRFARQDTLGTMHQQALWDGRYYSRVLRPYLWGLAWDLMQRRHGAAWATEERMQEALGRPAWDLLRPDGPGDGRTRDQAPTADEVGLVLARIEAL